MDNGGWLGKLPPKAVRNTGSCNGYLLDIRNCRNDSACDCHDFQGDRSTQGAWLAIRHDRAVCGNLQRKGMLLLFRLVVILIDICLFLEQINDLFGNDSFDSAKHEVRHEGTSTSVTGITPCTLQWNLR